MNTRITGLPLRATIGLSFAAVIVLAAISTGITFLFLSIAAKEIDSLSEIGAEQQKLVQNQRATLDDEKAAFEEQNLLLDNQAELDDLQRTANSLSADLVSLVGKVEERGKTARDSDESAAARLSSLKVLFHSDSPDTDAAFSSSLSTIDAGLEALAAHSWMSAPVAAYRDRIASFGAEVQAALLVPQSSRDEQGRPVRVNVSVFKITATGVDLGDYVESVGESLVEAVNRSRAESAVAKDGSGRTLKNLRTLQEELGAAIGTRRGELTASISSVRSRVDAGRIKVREGFDQLEKQSTEVIAGMNTARERSETPMHASWILFIFVLVVSIAATMWTAWMVSRPLRQLAAAAKEITDGDLSSRIETNRTDEVGQLARAFSAMVLEMNEILHEAQKVAEQVASSAAVLTSSAGGVMSQMDRQAEGIGEASSLVEDVRDRSEAIRDHATGAASASNEVMDHSSDGQRVVAATLQQMVHVSDTVSDSAQIIDNLGVASQEIGNIVSTISEIADQTNLLALNAAIEAARAGEHGRGFAVVADEVRKLAVNVSKSANEIIELISRFKRETERAVSSMQEGARVVKTGVSSANQAGESLATIIEAVRRVSSLMAQTDEATQSQVNATSEVRDTLGSLTKLSVGARDAAHRTAEEAEGLQKSVDNLQRLLSHFRLGRRAGTKEVKSLLDRKAARRRAKWEADEPVDDESAASESKGTIIRRSGRLKKAMRTRLDLESNESRDRTDEPTASRAARTESRSDARSESRNESRRDSEERRADERRSSPREGASSRRAAERRRRGE